MSKKWTAADIADAITRQIEPAVDVAHQLSHVIAPAATTKHSHKLAEARTQLAVANAHLSETVISFKRLCELLKGETS